ncbi:MAG: DUF2889 domain-containing protein [Deltaproteobacteria bacterium]|nr:DUF2889 domain-containing protein [Deltaproteobacteria bacterium]
MSDSADSADLVPAGEPIHRRSLEIDLGAEEGGRRELRARIVDRRLHGFTVAGAQAIGPGPIHDMSARLSVDVAARRVAAAEGAMALPAFHPSPITRGETCRDILPNFADLVGAPIDEKLVASIRSAIGRERGCYHLTSLVLAAVPVILSAVEEPEPRSEPRSRVVEISASSAGERKVRFHALLWERRAPGDLRRARLAFTATNDEMKLRDVVACAVPDLEPHAESAAALTDVPLFAGFARAALERLGSLAGTDEILDLALALSAVATQAFVHLPHSGERPSPGAGRAQSTCWMWRTGGPLESLPAGRLTRGDKSFPERVHEP